MNVAVVGMGLIGGSLAKSIKRHSGHAVYGLDIDPDVVTRAMMCARSTIRSMRIGFANAASCWWRCIRKSASTGSPKTRTGSRRTRWWSTAPASSAPWFGPIDAIARRYGWTYIGGHPMAGREFSRLRLRHRHAVCACVDDPHPAKDIDIARLEAAKAYFLAIGFRSVRITTPEEHDSMIAYTSQLAHIVSARM